MKKVKVAYVCVHNSCRSQIAEALTNHYFSDFFVAYSGGTETKPQINQDAARLVKQLHDIDMNQNQYSKLIDAIPEVDVLITMGCNVECPYLPCLFREDWGLDNPSGQDDQTFIKTIDIIYEKIKQLKMRIADQTIKL